MKIHTGFSYSSASLTKPKRTFFFTVCDVQPVFEIYSVMLHVELKQEDDGSSAHGRGREALLRRDESNTQGDQVTFQRLGSSMLINVCVSVSSGMYSLTLLSVLSFSVSVGSNPAANRLSSLGPTTHPPSPQSPAFWRCLANQRVAS